MLAQKIRRLLLTFWVGSLCFVPVVAWLVFHSDLTRGQAGAFMARVFEVEGWIGMVSAVYLLAYAMACDGLSALKQSGFWHVLAMFVLVGLAHFAIFPYMASLRSSLTDVIHGVAPAGSRFDTWHTISETMYFATCVLGLHLVWRGDTK